MKTKTLSVVVYANGLLLAGSDALLYGETLRALHARERLVAVGVDSGLGPDGMVGYRANRTVVRCWRASRAGRSLNRCMPRRVFAIYTPMP
jgi:hypothetical protein